MRTGPRRMRQLSARLLRHFPTPTDDQDVIPAIGRALSHVRGRPVRLRKTAFPPATASGVWLDRSSHDLIIYEENTDPEHHLVIIGHEIWHMFQGHCGSGAEHGPSASRAGNDEAAQILTELCNVIFADDADESPVACTDVSLHFAARSHGRQADEELDAERFGFRFATDVQAALQQARTPGDPHGLAGRIQASMAHRFHRV